MAYHHRTYIIDPLLAFSSEFFIFDYTTFLIAVINLMRNYHAHFESERYYHFFLSKGLKYIDPCAETFAYCLMPNHFHFLIKVRKNCFPKPPAIRKAPDMPDDEELNINQLMESRFKNLFSRYALAFNKQQKRHGSLFEKRFNRILIDSDHYLSKTIHYIHNNPIHHGFARDYRTWRFSSYRAILSDRPTHVKRDEILMWFGDKKSFIDFHNLNICYKEEIKDVAID